MSMRDWASAIHPAGDFSRADGKTVAAFVNARAPLGGSPLEFAAAILLLGYHGLPGAGPAWEAALAARPDSALIFDHGRVAEAQAAFATASGELRELASSWELPEPGQRSWSRKKNLADVLGDARKRFSDLSSTAEMFAASDIADLWAKRCAPEIKPWTSRDPAYALADSKHAALLGMLLSARRQGADFGPLWNDRHADRICIGALERLGPKHLNSLADDLFADPAERTTRMAKAFDRALELDREARLFCTRRQAELDARPSPQRDSGWMLAGFHLARENAARRALGDRLAAHLCRQAASPAPFGSESSDFWTILENLSRQKSSPFALRTHDLISEHPERIVDWAIAPSLPGSVFPTRALCAQTAAAAWTAMVLRKKQRGYAHKHILLARAHPNPEMESRCKALCPEPVASLIEQAEIESALAEHARDYGDSHSEPVQRPKPRL